MTVNFEKWNWWLSYISRSYTRARRLEMERAAFHEELYDAILYSTVHYDQEFRGNTGSPATEVQAMRIIEAKERYENKIKQEYERHKTWEHLLRDWVTEKEKIILIRHYQKRQRLDHEIILSVVSRMERDLTNLDNRINGERNQTAAIDFELYMSQTSSFRKPEMHGLKAK